MYNVAIGSQCNIVWFYEYVDLVSTNHDFQVVHICNVT